jgi:hypothetical protein
MAGPGAYGASKSDGVRSMEMIAAGKGGGGGGYDSAEDRSNSGSGPTGSSRSYPKGSSKPGNTQSADFNPQKTPVTDYRVGGV